MPRSPRSPPSKPAPAKRTPAKRSSQAAEYPSTVRFEAVMERIEATTSAAALKKLHDELAEIAILEEVDPKVAMRAYKQLNARILESDPLSKESFELQCIRDTLASS